MYIHLRKQFNLKKYYFLWLSLYRYVIFPLVMVQLNNTNSPSCLYLSLSTPPSISLFLLVSFTLSLMHSCRLKFLWDCDLSVVLLSRIPIPQLKWKLGRPAFPLFHTLMANQCAHHFYKAGQFFVCIFSIKLGASFQSNALIRSTVLHFNQTHF